MGIEKVKIKQFKVLEDIDQDLKGKSIMLVGDNGVGKSSFIQFIEIALGKQTNIPQNAEGEGEVLYNKGGLAYNFKVTFKKGKPVIVVTGPDGMKDDRKGTLAKIVGATDFDINRFVELSKSEKGRKTQLEEFKNTFYEAEEIAILEKIQTHIRIKFDERAALNKQCKELETVINANPLITQVQTQTFEKVDISGIYDELQAINGHNQKVTQVKERFDNRVREIERLAKEGKDLEAKLKAHKKQLQETIDLNAEAELWLNENPTKDSEALSQTIRTADEQNKKADAAEKLLNDIKNLETWKEEAGNMTVLIETDRQCIADTIRDMQGPLEDLSFDEQDNLLYKGVPVNPDNLSKSEIMELGIRLKMAENPELGILFIQEGESLGTDRLKEIKEIADKAGWQIIMEEVRRGTKELHVEFMAD